MKKNKGFTLIELLAIIVILAIIAVITVPVILNIIENSKKGAAKNSAYGYKDAINKHYLGKLTTDPSYELADGTYAVGDLDVATEGKQPDSNSWVTIAKNDVTNGCLQFDEYKVDITNGEVKDAVIGECEIPDIFNGKYIAPNTGDTHKGIIYMNPANTFEKCDETNYDSTPGTKTGCMKFYIFNEYTTNNTDYVDMILDHNTTPASFWTDYTYYYDSANCLGPTEALQKLYQDTKDWKKVPDLSSSKNYSFNSTARVCDISYTIDYTKHLEYNNNSYIESNGASKARFITASEVASIIQKSGFNTSDTSFYLDSKNSTTAATAENPSQYAWLYENTKNCENYGCKKQQNTSGISYNSGYWTSTAATAGYYSNESEANGNAWSVSSTGQLRRDPINSPNAGIRPVITMPKAALGIE